MKLAKAILLVTLTAACSTNLQTDEPAVVVTTPDVVIPAELTTLTPGLVRAWQGSDPEAIHVYYTDNAIVVTPTDRFSGWSDIRTRWITPVMTGGMTNFTAWPTRYDRDGNDIIEYGRYSFRMPMEGQVHTMTGGFAHRWQRQADGSWKIVSVSITNDPMK